MLFHTKNAGFVLACMLLLMLAAPFCRVARAYGDQGNIVLGMSAAFSGPSRELGIELYRGSRAYFDYINTQGGVGGRRIRILPLDDGYDPTSAIQNTIRLVNDPHVLCLFNYVGTPTVTRVLPLLKSMKQKRKFLFFPLSGAQPQREPPYSSFVFNLRASYYQEVQGLVDHLSLVGRRRIAVFYQNDAYGRSGWDGVRRALRLHRLEMVAEATYRRGAVYAESMKRQVGILKRGKPDAIISVGSYEACAAFIRDARDAGLDIPIANLSFSGSESLLNLLLQQGKDSEVDYTSGLINSQVVPSCLNVKLSAVELYRKLMRNDPAPPAGFGEGYEPPDCSAVSLEGFLNAVVMVHILELQQKRPEVPISELVEGIRDFDAGIDATVSFGPDRHQGLNRVYYTAVEDGRFVSLSDEGWGRWNR